ncbi:MAG: shikimate kinase [Candidatus Sulfotelmatobacter sp.]
MLVGFMGAGKSSVGRALAEQMGWSFEDLDQRIERREKTTIAEIFRSSGEAEFRRSEHEALKEMLEELDSGSGKVIALGGGAFVHESNARLIESLKIPTVFLDANVQELWRRCMRQSAETGMERPLLKESEGFRALYEKRRPYYLKASLIHDTGGKMIEQIAAELIQALGLARRGGNRGENQ